MIVLPLPQQWHSPARDPMKTLSQPVTRHLPAQTPSGTLQAPVLSG